MPVFIAAAPVQAAETKQAPESSEVQSGQLVMLSIHTVFEGHDYQNPTRLKAFVKDQGIHHLVGIDRHQDGERLPQTMKAYHTRGTPEMAIVDQHGNIRFQHFGGFEPAGVETLIQNLLNENRLAKTEPRIPPQGTLSAASGIHLVDANELE